MVKNLNEKLIVLMGMPSSGKSTWCEKYVAVRDPTFVEVLSADTFREYVVGPDLQKAHQEPWRPTLNSIIFSIIDGLAIKHLNDGKTVILDETALHWRARERMRRLARRANVEAHLVVFDRTASAFQWNRDRDKLKQVPEDVMEHMYSQFGPAKERILEEGWDDIIYVR